MFLTKDKAQDLSPLEMDMAVSRVRLAAMKAKAGLAVDDAECQSAVVLMELLNRQLKTAKASGTISEELVPEEAMRRMLQENLATLNPSRAELAVDVQQIPALVSWLDELSKKSLSQQQATGLLSALQKLSYAPTQPEAVPDPKVITDADCA